jgi:hypothetical protein
MYIIKYNLFLRTLLTFTFLTCQERKRTDKEKERIIDRLSNRGCEVLLLAWSNGLTWNLNYVQDCVESYGKVKTQPREIKQHNYFSVKAFIVDDC